jgi:hypothetical protein
VLLAADPPATLAGLPLELEVDGDGEPSGRFSLDE